MPCTYTTTTKKGGNSIWKILVVRPLNPYSIRFITTSQAVELGALPPRTSISPVGRDCFRFTTSLPLPIRVTSTSKSPSFLTFNWHFSLMATSLTLAGVTLKSFWLTSNHRSEECRVGKECRSRWSPYHYKKNKKPPPVIPAAPSRRTRLLLLQLQSVHG